jgi:hypothetical protein
MLESRKFDRKIILLTLLLIGLVSAFAMDLDCLLDGCQRCDNLSICHTERNLIDDSTGPDLAFLNACAFIGRSFESLTGPGGCAWSLRDPDLHTSELAFPDSPSLRAPPA